MGQSRFLVEPRASLKCDALPALKPNAHVWRQVRHNNAPPDATAPWSRLLEAETPARGRKRSTDANSSRLHHNNASCGIDPLRTMAARSERFVDIAGAVQRGCGAVQALRGGELFRRTPPGACIKADVGHNFWGPSGPDLGSILRPIRRRCWASKWGLILGRSGAQVSNVPAS